ncbi:MAG: dihydropteroate synthase [Collinsella sp.]|uniref:Dihydropteroate synthase n=1 Tax=Collinsella intestinalis DSM 13280 TaxID=521003 RepID=C4FB99_9ACTN|nr:dihydropteroate synthase [Collinsella intestinalis]EEP43944.1 dihydropteroate synthase [Collinsella intestinalis DSM 13280]MDO5364206.1 dihydropteroate synthase [Collinsella sp.]VWM24425.1 Dihydropteroate synthase [Collinsella intestinalis]
MARDSKVWRCGKYELKFDRPRIMGVLNVTPDSFSDGGEHLDTDAAIAHGLKMLDDGADIIDVGGESTRPGFTPVDPDTEARRVLPVVQALAKAGAVVSIDTRHVEVAKAAVRVGASIVNDVTGFTDPRMVDFVKESDCGLVVMHAGEVADVERPRTHTEVQLDTSAAAFMAQKAREAEEAARALGATGKSKRAAKAKLISGMVQPLQPQLPFDAPAPAADAEQAAPAPGASAAVAFDATDADAVSASVEDAPSSDDLASVMARSGATAYNGSRSAQLRRFTLPDSAPIMRRVMGFLSDQARALIHAGVARERICLDPGSGFGKEANEDIVIQRELGKIASLGYPTLCAVSRKRLVGAISGVANARERDIATFGVCLGAIEQGANIVRVHNVAGFAQFLNGFWAIARPQPRRAYVALGSNEGDRLENIRTARDLIAQIPMTCVSSCSRIYESEPAYETDQDAFANAVIEIKTELAPLILLDELGKVELQLGRDRSGKAKANGPRPIDCDLLWMDNEIHGGNKLRLPHPGLGERDFVLVPLEDLMHNPARFFRYEGIDVKEPEDRVGHVVAELGTL